MALGCA